MTGAWSHMGSRTLMADLLVGGARLGLTGSAAPLRLPVGIVIARRSHSRVVIYVVPLIWLSPVQTPDGSTDLQQEKCALECDPHIVPLTLWFEDLLTKGIVCDTWLGLQPVISSTKFWIHEKKRSEFTTRTSL